MDKIVLNFHYPYYFLLLILPLLVRYFLPECKNISNKDIVLIRHPYVKRLKEAFSGLGQSNSLKNRKEFAFCYFLWICFVVALASPRISEKNLNIGNYGDNFFAVFDVSMPDSQADIFKIKFSQINESFNKFMSKRSNDNAGVILLNNEANIYVPLTKDFSSISLLMNNINLLKENYFNKDSYDAVGDAISLATKNFAYSGQKSSVVLFLYTNKIGGNVPLDKAAEIAQKHNIKINIIHIVDNSVGLFFDQNVSDKLKQASIISGGKYFLAANIAQVNQALSVLNKIEEKKVIFKDNIIYHNLYRYPLFLAIMLIFYLLFANIYKKMSYGNKF